MQMPHFHRTHPLRTLLAAGLVLLSAVFAEDFFSGRGGQAPSYAEQPPLVTIEKESVPLAQLPETVQVRMPEASGKVVYSGKSAVIDASNTSQGYVMVKYTGASSKVKLQISGSNRIVYTYDLHKGSYDTFPLTSGDGNYQLNLYEHVRDSQYSLAMNQTISVKLASSLLPYLYPNQYVNYSAGSQTVAKGAQLAAGAENQLTIVQNIYTYVVSHITYDTQKANTVTSGYLPVVDNILSSGKGICFDYAAVMAAMLRTQNIPTRLEVGYASGGIYHAWVSVYLEQQGWVNGIIYFDGKTWKLMDPTFASSARSSDSIMKFIGNGSNYSTKYVY
ncbi:transglutaminase domain-containing protein [Marasmitruncus massiliensis]|uniref:transglutaminase domain-containing protein n=1 Tax=Marasmitruncus massiliensis TaxID=1944642 RepID=UPI0015E12219|nr:transglutaminase domain-containing protein [Marasmitruncus massiliensis]